MGSRSFNKEVNSSSVNSERSASRSGSPACMAFTSNSTGTSVRFHNASDIADWTDASVVALRVALLARSTDAEAGYKNTSSYALGSQTVTVNDSYQRQVFQQVVQVRR